MCTAVSWCPENHYFGRNLDLECSYHETVAITPRYYPFHFLNIPSMYSHYAMIGMATVVNGCPLYYEATNEMGLSMAGLNYPGLAHYRPVTEGRENIASFELIPWLLSSCSNICEAKKFLSNVNITNQAFSEEFAPTPLHWMISDRNRSITLEATTEGLRIHENTVGVLTNNPSFDYHLYNLSSYMQVSANPPADRFSDHVKLIPFSNGMGGIGLPGDYSSTSRFVRASFVKLNSKPEASENECVSQFFHILNSVAMPKGCVRMPDGRDEITVYSCCCNTDEGTYYYVTYGNSRVTAVNMYSENLNDSKVITYPLRTTADFYYENRPQEETDSTLHREKVDKP